jgi:centractin
MEKEPFDFADDDAISLLPSTIHYDIVPWRHHPILLYAYFEFLIRDILEEMAEANQPIVIDNGTGVMKAGFAGGDKPRVVFRSCVGRIKHPRVMPGGALESGSSDGGLFIGAKVEEHRGALKIDYPMENGIVTNWADMEKIWSYLYTKDNLNVASEEHAVLLTEAPLNPYANREKAAEILFEALNVPACFFSIQAILSLYASGRTTGVVLDSGDGVTHVVPVYEGLALPHAISRMDIAGRTVTRQLQILLRRSIGLHLHTSSEMEIVRTIKEQHCHIAFNPNKAEDQEIKVPYKLPDGSTIELGQSLCLLSVFQISNCSNFLFSHKSFSFDRQ